jgi:hypothetical protein
MTCLKAGSCYTIAGTQTRKPNARGGTRAVGEDDVNVLGTGYIDTIGYSLAHLARLMQDFGLFAF